MTDPDTRNLSPSQGISGSWSMEKKDVTSTYPNSWSSNLFLGLWVCLETAKKTQELHTKKHLQLKTQVLCNATGFCSAFLSCRQFPF